MQAEWVDIRTDVRSVDWQGNLITIEGVRAKRKKGTKQVIVDIEDIARAELENIANEVGIELRDIPLFLMLYARPGPFQRGYLCQKYRLNKMLFYQWKELEKDGLGEALPHDEFIAEKRGPVPKNLWDDLKRLNDAGLIAVEGGKRIRKTVTAELTPEGQKIAAKLWTLVPDPYIVVTSRVKDWLFPLDERTIRERVHSDYPEFRKKYTVLDREDRMNF